MAKKEIEVVWREIKHKKFRGKDALLKAKLFSEEKNSSDNVEDMEVFEVIDDDTTAYFEIENNFERVATDG